MTKQVEHYSLDDLGYSYSFDESFNIIESIDINNLSSVDIIGLFPITKYLEDIPSLNDEAKKRVESNKQKIEAINKKLGRYFSKLLDEEFVKDIQVAHSKEGLIAHTYIQALEHYTSVFRITWHSINYAVSNHIVPLYLILQQKKIASYFSNELKAYILSIPEGIDYLVREYDENSRATARDKYYLPSFSIEEIDTMIENYLNYEYANLNVAGCLKNHKNEPNTYVISPLTKAKIKKGYDKLNKNLFKKGVVWSNDYNIRIDPNQEEPALHFVEDKYNVISYSGKWIIDNIDSKPTILNNLIYIFEFTDLNLRFSYLPQENSGSGLSDLFENKNKNEYGNMTFHNLDGIFDVSFLAYYQFLSNKGVSLESIYVWFSSEYIKQEFGLSGFEISLPVKDHSMLVKCKNLFSEIDRLLKSYMVFQKYGTIDSDIYLEETLCKLDKLKSLTGDKYIYPTNDNDLRRIMFLLFSDQSMLNYVSRQKEDKNFFELLRKNTVLFSEYREYSQRDLLFLKDKKIIDVLENGEIVLANFKEITILKEFYFKGFLDLCLLSESFIETIAEFEKRGWLEKSDSLFSKQEADYLDYYLNNSKFTNALALRNRYEHPVELNPSEDDMFKHYVKGLKILGLIIIKINAELCKKYPENK